MSTEMELWSKLRQVVTENAIDAFRHKLADMILVGPFDDRGYVLKEDEQGEGFSIFIGSWRFGWWKTRRQACDAAETLACAIRSREALP